MDHNKFSSCQRIGRHLFKCASSSKDFWFVDLVLKWEKCTSQNKNAQNFNCFVLDHFKWL